MDTTALKLNVREGESRQTVLIYLKLNVPLVFTSEKLG